LPHGGSDLASFYVGGSLLLIAYKLDAYHEARAAHVADKGELFLQFPEFTQDLLALNQGFFGDFLPEHEIEIGQAGRAGYGVAAEGGQVVTGLEGIGDFRPGNESREGEAIGYALGEGHDIRLHIIVLHRKEFARTTIATLDLVEEEEDAVFIQGFLNFFKIFLGGNYDSALAHHGFGDKGSDIFRSVELNSPLQLLGAVHIACRIAHGVGAAIAVSGGMESDAGDVWTATLFPILVARYRQSSQTSSMERALKGYELGLLGILLGHAHGAFDGLGTAVSKKGFLEPSRGHFGELLGQIGHRNRMIDIGAGVHHFIDLSLGGRGHFGD